MSPAASASAKAIAAVRFSPTIVACDCVCRTSAAVKKYSWMPIRNSVDSSITPPLVTR